MALWSIAVARIERFSGDTDPGSFSGAPVGYEPLAPTCLLERRGTPKIVASRTLKEADFGARRIGGNPADEVTALKRQPSKDLLLVGWSGPAASLADVASGLPDDDGAQVLIGSTLD
ncbi:hypothetical protein [Micromonospora sp. NPDC093244]|uniref:hypothetical protein n=1 Tax=Micromonospora sp. NPDC093244 TaxID=3155071 RepID=UPI0034307D1A